MRQWLTIALAVLCFFSCKKDMTTNRQSGISDEAFFKSVNLELVDSLSNNDHANMDESRWYKSKDVQSHSYFVRIAFEKKDIATDFILLRTDSLGKIKEGRIIHVDKENDAANPKDSSFNGQILMASLNREKSVVRQVVKGRWKQQSAVASFVKEEPAGTQNLPEVVVTSYSSNVSSTGNWYLYGALFGYYNYGWNDVSIPYTYGNAGGGGSNSSSSNDHQDNTIQVKIEPNDNTAIKVVDYLKCFTTIPDNDATYKITLYSDLPVNGDPSKFFNWSTNSPGHSFIQLNKYNGTQSIQQNIGFYPEFGWKSTADIDVNSKVADNAGHEFNASLSLSIDKNQFQAALDKIQSLSGRDYNIATWNCTDFALNVFNAASPHALSIPQFAIPSSIYPQPFNLVASNTPQGLYNEIKLLESTHNSSYGSTEIPGVCGYVGSSHGSCK